MLICKYHSVNGKRQFYECEAGRSFRPQASLAMAYLDDSDFKVARKAEAPMTPLHRLSQPCGVRKPKTCTKKATTTGHLLRAMGPKFMKEQWELLEHVEKLAMMPSKMPQYVEDWRAYFEHTEQMSRAEAAAAPPFRDFVLQ